MPATWISIAAYVLFTRSSETSPRLRGLTWYLVSAEQCLTVYASLPCDRGEIMWFELGLNCSA